MLSSGAISDRKQPEKQKYLKWLKEEKAKGLVDIKPTFNYNYYDLDKGILSLPKGITEEDIYKELNAINDALTKGKFKTVAHFNAKGKSLI